MKINSIIQQLFKNLELLFWSSALLFLAINPPSTGDFTLCIFKNIGFENCMGCGIGHSISYIFRGDFSGAYEAHPLGFPILLFLFYHIFQLIWKRLRVDKRSTP